MKYVSLTKGKRAIVDDDDFEKVNKHKWYCSFYGYAVREDRKNHIIGLHTFIMNTPDGYEIDHRNLDKLDNRKENLRICTNKQNARNKFQKNNKTGYKGVSISTWNKSNPYRVTINLNKKQIQVGYFKTAIEAAKAYNEVVKKYHGEFAYINKI